ncbi:MAG: KTSC domain-containing protein [Dehalococcoides mccartyi]|uniref:KTSC domain-containing protein n=1 Tax=Dehalococcoides TaxID=61434 RepID=UPI002737F568|nr:KTSC domain-containing protein [Dehalococcoides mccartyi]MDP4280182.1 KTSC domain-containing protein [Dehalococcoides mccartyi]
MERIPVDSSNLASIGYDVASFTLEVEFINGTIYQYSGVPENEYNGLMSASSKGSYLNQQIKKAGYPYTRVC